VPTKYRDVSLFDGLDPRADAIAKIRAILRAKKDLRLCDDFVEIAQDQTVWSYRVTRADADWIAALRAKFSIHDRELL